MYKPTDSKSRYFVDMKYSELIPKAETQSVFDILHIRQMPEMSGCYILTNFHGEIIYIGLAKNLRKRVLQHLENPEKNTITKSGKIYYIYYKVLDNELKINQLERGWLNEYELVHGGLPPLNKIHSPL
jgi:predicted GIY-YIG superfamily endonuclease